MKNIIIVFCLIGNIVNAQQIVTTYYDWQKTRKKEVYQVDANGEKHGSYKYYDENGILTDEVQFKYGRKNGLWVTYTRFPNYSGTLQVKSKEMYVNDLREGLATYYLYSEYLGIFEFQKGNYKNDVEEGEWTIISDVVQKVNYGDLEYIRSSSSFKGSMHLKEIITYENGEKVLYNGKHIVYYYPSKKIYHSFEINNGKYIGSDSYFMPDGKIWSTKMFDGSGNLISAESYYLNGNLRYKEVQSPYSYEGYNSDGTPDRSMIEQNRIIQNMQEVTLKAKQFVAEGNLKKGIDYLQSGSEANRHYGSDREGWWIESQKLLNEWKETYNKELKETEKQQKILEEKKLAEEKRLKELPQVINQKHSEFEKLYVEKKEIPFVVDSDGKPMIKKSYPKGKHIYEKSMIVYYELANAYNSEKDNSKLLALGEDIITLLDKLISLAATDTKPIDKELKNAETSAEIKKILGL